MPPPASRRQFLRRFASLAACGSVSGGGAFGYGNLVERHWIQTVARDITLPALPAMMDGFRIVQLSDLHLEPWTKAEHIAEAVVLANALKPDLMVITGDFLTNSSKPAGRLAEVLAPLEARYGVLGCIGNHDLWHQPDVLQRLLKERKIDLLRNEGMTLQTERGTIFIAGLESAWSGRADARAALRDWTTDLPLVILAHEPDQVDRVAQTGVPALQLSGHTHGGQVCVPLPWPLALHLPAGGKKYRHGHHRVGSVQLYVNRGIGCVGAPVRIACPPEVTVITLRSPAVLA
ncbi:MAG: metallophosphoesterase [Verrucomicrobiaceae bacterium]|nr:metallophosphoesterase [Verrucomicrobiaceae bacterium]